MQKNFIIMFVLFVYGFSFIDKDESIGTKAAFYECSDPMKNNYDLFKLEENKTYFDFNLDLIPKNLKALDFIWYEDKLEGYFTGYLINNSKTKFEADRQDGSLIMIQEALNSKGKWMPIEHWVYSGCGNSYFSPLSLDSGKYVMIAIKKYTGSYKTKIRLKLKKDSVILYSSTFEASIDTLQFRKETNPVNGILYHGPASYLED